MSDNTKGGKIFDPKDADFLNDQGKESQDQRTSLCTTLSG